MSGWNDRVIGDSARYGAADTKAPIADDAQAFFEGYASRPAATRYMTWVQHQTLAETEKFVEDSIKGWACGKDAPWTIVARDSGVAIGAIEFRESGESADFGYVLCERDWGKGFATEAARAVAALAWDRSALHRLWASCHPDNSASVGVLTKVGLTFEARVEGIHIRPQLGPLAGPSLMFSQSRAK